MAADSSSPQQSSAATQQPTYALNWPHQILSVLGFAISIFSCRMHALVKAGQSVSCGPAETFDCNKAMSSPYAELFHIPLGVYGMVYFAVIFILSIDTDLQPAALRRSALLRFLVASAGFAVSLCLIGVMKFVIHAWCPTCLATHTTTFLIFLTALYQLLRTRRATSVASGAVTVSRDAGENN